MDRFLQYLTLIPTAVERLRAAGIPLSAIVGLLRLAADIVLGIDKRTPA